VEHSSAGLIIRQREPRNLESPFDRLDGYLTPTELFYIRSHFPTPALDRAAYRLHIDGAVRQPFVLSYEELRRLPAETRVATLECAGNSRVFLVPQMQGAQWELGAAGNAEWTGVPLRTLLRRAGLADDACEIVLEGADRGTPKEEPRPADPMAYAWSVPRAKALQPEVLIAYQMNGRELTPDHGFPVRAIVPGHYGMASVKWLTRIAAVRQPFHGYWQTTDYGYWESLDGNPVRRALGEMQLKSEIARPRVYFRRRLGRRELCDRSLSERRRRPNLGRGATPRPRATLRLAAVEVRLADAENAGPLHAAFPRPGRERRGPTR
jgi:DMSO/TMAO reductase YedYZ molybdopterin-dependent catalytic subunit